MVDDDGKEFSSVIVPLSLIQKLSEGLLQLIDEWHEQRGIEDLNLEK